MVNFNKIIERISVISGKIKDKEIAEIIGLSAPDFSKRKKKGTDSLIRHFLEWGIKNNINLNWLFLGYGSPYLDTAKNTKAKREEMLKSTLNFLENALSSDEFEIKIEMIKKAK